MSVRQQKYCAWMLQYPKVGQLSGQEVASACDNMLPSSCWLRLLWLLASVIHGQVHDSPVIERLLSHA